MQVTADRLRDVVARHLDLEPDRLTDEALLDEDLFLDSLASTELLVVLEDDLGISLPEDLYDGVRTYGDFVAAVQRHAGS